MTFLAHIVEMKGVRAVVITALLGVCCWSAYLGVAGMTGSPVFVDQYGKPTFLPNFLSIKSIERVAVTPAFFAREPLFAEPDQVDRWWRIHLLVEQVLQGKRSAVIDYGDHAETFLITYPSVKQSLQKFKLIYFMGLIYVLSACCVYMRHKTVESFLLTVFLMGGGIYIFSAAPLYENYLLLPMPQLKPLVAISYLSSCLMTAGIYFALVFPRPKSFVKRFPVLVPLSLLGYCFVIPVLYFFVVGSSLPSRIWPLFVIFCGMIIVSWIHSIMTERDTSLKKHLFFSLAIPIGGPIVLPALYLQPDLFGLATVGFGHLTLLFLIFLIAVVLFFDTTCSYFRRLQVVEQSNKHKESLRRDLHDGILNKLASISALSEASIYLMEEKSPEALEKVRSIRSQIAEQSQYARGMLWITDRQCDSWGGYFSKLRHCGNELSGDHDIEFSLEYDITKSGRVAPMVEVKICLYFVLIEALSNAIKHALANQISARFVVERDRVSVSITDNGVGIKACTQMRCPDNQASVGGMGLHNMRDRVEELDGSLDVLSLGSGGTTINLKVPLQAESLSA